MNIPAHLRYTPHHLWIKSQPDDTVLAGITDHAQETLGDIVFLELPSVGTSVTQEQPCGLIESVKTASDLHAPMSGQIVEINQALQTSPEQINSAPYAAWIFRIKPEHVKEWDSLLSDEAYRQQLDQ